MFVVLKHENRKKKYGILNQSFKKNGIVHTLKRGIYLITSLLYYKTFYHNKSFFLQGKKYHYFYSLYNNTWLNDRTVEIPIIMKIIQQYKGKNILELGNVLSHYFDFPHDVVDKYENGMNIINQDIVEFNPKKKYDLIISISTLEHIGWDESPRDDTKIPRVIMNLKSLLSENGMMVITFPIGYNQALDNHRKLGKIRFQNEYYMKRLGENHWTEAKWNEVKLSTFGEPFEGSNGLVIGMDRK